MSKEITTQATFLIGATVYASADRFGQRWNGSAFEAVLLSHWGTYAFALAEATGTGFFSADMPAGINTAGPVDVTLYQQASASPAATDRVVGSGSVQWSGSSVVYQTGDGFARLGAPTGASIAVDIQTRSTYNGGAVASVTDKTGYALSSAGLDSVIVESGLNARQSLSLLSAIDLGNATGLGTTAVAFAGAGVSTPRVSAVLDSAGNRTVTLHAPV